MNDLALAVPVRYSPSSILDVIRSAAPTLGVRCDSAGDDGQLVRLRRGDRVRLVHADGCCNENHVSVEIAQDADLARTFLLEAGIPVPNVVVAAHAEEAVRAAILWSGPVAVAPVDGNRRASAIARFDSPDEIRAAFMRTALPRGRAAVVGPLHGFDHRVLVVGGAGIAAARCMPPYVTGDGESSVRSLIAAANRNGDAKRRAAIPCDGLTELAVARQGFTLDSRPRAGTTIRLREGCDHRDGAHVEDVTAAMDRDLARECARATRQIGLDVAEVRVMCRDISLPLAPQGGCIVAIDPSPDVTIHHSVDGSDTHGIGRALMDLLFPEA
jgi:cyanophycin synthetase